MLLCSARKALSLSSRSTAGQSEALLEHVVVRSATHGGHGDLLTHGAGDDDERQIHAARFDQLERLGAGELRHRVVAQHDIPGSLVERLLEPLACVDADGDHPVAAALDLPHD
jgi:hypothetical protein